MPFNLSFSESMHLIMILWTLLRSTIVAYERDHICVSKPRTWKYVSQICQTLHLNVRDDNLYTFVQVPKSYISITSKIHPRPLYLCLCLRPEVQSEHVSMGAHHKQNQSDTTCNITTTATITSTTTVTVTSSVSSAGFVPPWRMQVSVRTREWVSVRTREWVSVRTREWVRVVKRPAI